MKGLKDDGLLCFLSLISVVQIHYAPSRSPWYLSVYIWQGEQVKVSWKLDSIMPSANACKGIYCAGSHTHIQTDTLALASHSNPHWEKDKMTSNGFLRVWWGVYCSWWMPLSHFPCQPDTHTSTSRLCVRSPCPLAWMSLFLPITSFLDSSTLFPAFLQSGRSLLKLLLDSISIAFFFFWEAERMCFCHTTSPPFLYLTLYPSQFGCLCQSLSSCPTDSENQWNTERI